jgi:hypothetical protein
MVAAVSVASQKFVQSQLAARKVESIDMLPKETRREIKKQARAIAYKDVFGEGHKVAKDGTPIEQGTGSPGNMTAQCIEAYIKNQTERRKGGPEEGYEDNLKKMRAQLAECNARRRIEEADDDDDD